MGSVALGPKSLRVLTRTPRDCTAPARLQQMYSPVGHAVSHTMSKKSVSKQTNNELKREISELKSSVNNLKVKTRDISLLKLEMFNKNKTAIAVGQPAAGFIGKIFGVGDYKTNFSEVSKASYTMPVPAFGGATIITHREYITDVISSATAGAFSISSYNINPGLYESYPWLSSIAENYEEYELLGMVYEFKTMSGNAIGSTNTALGSVILATQYDPTKPVFEDKQEMENYFFAQSCKPAESVMHAVECAKSQTPSKSLYVRTGSTTITGPDLRWNDFGKFSIATVGLQGASVNIGELWVTYRVALRKPRLPSGGVPTQLNWRGYNTNTSGTDRLGTTTVYDKGSLDCTMSNNTLYIETALPGEVYRLTFMWQTSYVGTANVATYINCALSTGQYNNGSISAIRAVEATLYVFEFIVVSTLRYPGKIGVTIGGITPSTGGALDCFVVTMDPKTD